MLAMGGDIKRDRKWQVSRACNNPSLLGNVIIPEITTGSGVVLKRTARVCRTKQLIWQLESERHPFGRSVNSVVRFLNILGSLRKLRLTFQGVRLQFWKTYALAYFETRLRSLWVAKSCSDEDARGTTMTCLSISTPFSLSLFLSLNLSYKQRTSRINVWRKATGNDAIENLNRAWMSQCRPFTKHRASGHST